MAISHRWAQLVCGGTVAATALGCVSAAVASDWPELRGNAQRTSVSSETVAPPLALLWRFTGGYQNANTSAAVVSGKTAYFVTKGNGTQGGYLYALDLDTGAKRWSFPQGENGLPQSHVFSATPTVANGKVYVGASDGAMYVIDATTGQEVIKFNTGRPVNSSAILADNILYFGSNSGTFYALNPETGEIAPGWRKNYDAGDAVNSAPLIADTMVIIQSADNTLHGIKRATGIPKWKYRLPYGANPNTLTFGDGSLYIPSGRRLFALLPASGALRWATELPEDIMGSPISVNGTVYVACRDDQGSGARLYAIKASNGRGEWDGPARIPNTISSAPVVAGNYLFAAGSRGTLTAIDRESGSVKWNYRMEASSNRPAVTASNFQGQDVSSANQAATNKDVTVVAPLTLSDGTLLVVSNDGTLSAFRADAPDTTGPVSTDQFPRTGTSISGRPPFTAAVKFADFGSGVNVDSLKASLDGKAIEVGYDALKGWAYFQTQSTGKMVDPPLSNGRHVITFTVNDYAGNETASTWSFVVDNNLAPTAKSAPVAPKKTDVKPGADKTKDGKGGNRPSANPGSTGAGAGRPLGGASGFPGRRRGT